MTLHRAKMTTGPFGALVAGDMRHDLRRIGDVPFLAGDMVLYFEVETNTGHPTGRTHEAEVTYVTWEENKCALSDSGLRVGYAILSLAAPGAGPTGPCA